MARRANERHVQSSASARCRAAAALFWPLATAVVLGAAGCASVDAASPAMTAKPSKIKQAASDTPVAGDSASIIDGVFGGLAYANKESVCANSSLFDVEEFPGSGKFRAGDIARLQKSTVRLRFTHKHLAEAIFKDRIQSRYPDATNFSLGGFTSFAGKDEGLCSGTLIGGNIVLTAGHCVSRAHWNGEGLEFPSYERGGRRVTVTTKQFALFLVADFNRQQNLSAVASADPLPFADRPFYPFTVRELVAPGGEPDDDLDYAILRIRGTQEQIGQYALGTGNVRYPRNVDADGEVAVIQHPTGLYKKVAIGQPREMTGDRLLHSASTSGGSSGAGVISDGGKLIAIHVEGGCSPMGLNTANHALPLWRIRPQLSAALNGGN